MAANAVLRLIERYEIDPQNVGFLGLGTESSTDNAAGAIIVKGMVDQALVKLGKAPLSRSCEVPEFKHACLGGIYATKGAARWLSCEGEGRLAIVVSADIAEYERGSSGEQTQGAGAVAFLMESDPKLFEIDLRAAGTSAAYRGIDFRKPFARHFMPGYAQSTPGMHDYPVFNGKYSTACYVDAVIHALEAVLAKVDTAPQQFYDELAGVLFHRPYHHMPIAAMAAVTVQTLVRDATQRERLETLCAEVGLDPATVVQEVLAQTDLLDVVLSEGPDADPTPAATALAKAVRKTPWFKAFVDQKMTLGNTLVRELGNLYTASLPAWVGAALEDAASREQELAGRTMLLVGYGSGDAAEALPVTIVPGWREAADKIALAATLDGAIDLSQAQYEALHDGRKAEDLAYAPTAEFVIERVGERNEPGHQDIGIEFYTYVA